MAWMDADWTYRAPILVDKLTAGTAAVDVTALVPATLEDFWANVRTDGYDIRITEADGITPLTYDFDSFSVANRTCTLEIQGFVPPHEDAMCVAWLYWGNSAASDGRTIFTPATPRTGYLTAARPAGVLVRHRRPMPGQSAPSDTIALTTGEDLRPWLLLDDALEPLAAAYEGRLWGEEIAWIQEQILRADADDSTRYDETQIRMSGRGAIRAHVEDGILTDATDYTLRLLVGTTESRIIDARALLAVRDIDEGA